MDQEITEKSVVFTSLVNSYYTEIISVKMNNIYVFSFFNGSPFWEIALKSLVLEQENIIFVWIWVFQGVRQIAKKWTKKFQKNVKIKSPNFWQNYFFLESYTIELIENDDSTRESKYFRNYMQPNFTCPVHDNA